MNIVANKVANFPIKSELRRIFSGIKAEKYVHF